MSWLFDAIVSAITSQLGTASTRTRADVIIFAVTMVLGLVALLFLAAVFRDLG